jgi:DNA-binding NarL/FixJ family response regulator
MHSESLYAERALRAGALGYVNKDQATDRIIEAIRRVLAGKVYLSEANVSARELPLRLDESVFCSAGIGHAQLLLQRRQAFF